MNPTTIRQFETGDASGIARLHKKHGRWFEEPEVSLDHIIECSLRPDFRFFIAEKEGTVVGYAGVLFQQNAGRAELGPICVSDEFRNTGLGSRLLEKAVEFMRERSIHRITAKVKSGNQEGMLFFQTNGFKKEAVLEKYTKKGEDAIQMVRFI